MDAAQLVRNLRPELSSDGRDGGIGELAMAQTDAAQGIDQNIAMAENDMRS